MSDHPAKAHRIGGFVILLIVCAVLSLLFGLLAGGTFLTGLPAGIALLAFGVYGQLVLARDES